MLAHSCTRTHSSSGDSTSSCSSVDSHLQVDPGPLVRFSFIEPGHYGAHYLRATLSKHPQFCDGFLLDSKEKGVIFPVVHFTESHALTERLLGEHALGEDFVLHQGLYREVRSIVPDLNYMPPFIPCQSCYMLLGFKSLDRSFNQVMVDTWKDWTGARYIYMYLPDELGLTRISLYRRELPDGMALFMYLVLVECANVQTKQQQIQLLDFAQRLRVERITGYISVYSAEPRRVKSSFCFSKPDRFGDLINGLETTHPPVNCK